MPYVRPPRMQQPQSMPEAKVPLPGKSIAETAAQTALLVKKSRDLLDGVRFRVKEEAISRRAVSDQLRTANVEGSPPLRAPCIESPPQGAPPPGDTPQNMSNRLQADAPVATATAAS